MNYIYMNECFDICNEEWKKNNNIVEKLDYIYSFNFNNYSLNEIRDIIAINVVYLDTINEEFNYKKLMTTFDMYDKILEDENPIQNGAMDFIGKAKEMISRVVTNKNIPDVIKNAYTKYADKITNSDMAKKLLDTIKNNPTIQKTLDQVNNLQNNNNQQQTQDQKQQSQQPQQEVQAPPKPKEDLLGKIKQHVADLAKKSYITTDQVWQDFQKNNPKLKGKTFNDVALLYHNKKFTDDELRGILSMQIGGGSQPTSK